ncbi:EB domain containing protein [Trichuris trichiura]|uniref:EB domain containing protein n=1 Tax=Trichuris trichiura TaxID=36087 RepID=A0A077ZKZ8_TRITR|nr:EB domain containing protein [Trichuris trichiura]
MSLQNTCTSAGKQGTQAKAPGSKCSSNEECSGSKSRLASCHKHTCTCLPPAKPMKGTCILRPLQKSASRLNQQK